MRPNVRQYTVACRIKQIIGTNGESLSFYYAKKTSAEYARWNTSWGKPTTIRQLRGTFSASGTGTWDLLSKPDPRIRIEVTGANGFSRTFERSEDDTCYVNLDFDLPPETPQVLTLHFHAEDKDPISSDEMLDRTFKDVASICGFEALICPYLPQIALVLF